ncbi:hypothetical protein [Streptomyces sp. NPDC037389]|uniref:hypothetical protein n=1 Tax=Streptomyces sp. NPDC037389 TaxID=3155369 RepID=UPI0033F13BC3
MEHASLKIAAATAVAAVSIGIAGPIANAAEAHRTTAAAVSAPAVSDVELAAFKTMKPQPATTGKVGVSAAALAETAGTASTEEMQIQGRLSGIIKMLKKSPKHFKAAIKAAKRGWGAYQNWINSLPWYSPVKWALKTLPPQILWDLFQYLVNQ